MASKSPNFFTRIKENVMGTKEQNKAAQERMDAAAAKRKKERETAAAVPKLERIQMERDWDSELKAAAAKKKKEAEDKTKMNKGGAVKKKVPTKMAKGSKATKTPVLAIMIGVPKAPKAKKK
jgi:hypothetical protein